MKKEKRIVKKNKITNNNYHTLLSASCFLLLSSFFLLLSSFLSCTSLIEKAGKALDGSNEKVIEHYQSEQGIGILKVLNRKNEESILITLNEYPMIKLRASLPDENGFFYVTALEYFASYVNGWNEFSMAMLGSGSLLLIENAKLENIKELEHIQITNGRIHRYESRITGDEALTALRNRNERILAITDWMLNLEDKPENFKSIENFNDYWMPVILPEMVPKRKKPENWLLEGDKFVRGEDIKWNIGYSERIFPEELRPVRDSGTMLRDLEEALHWIYMEYHWENIVELLSREIFLNKLK